MIQRKQTLFLLLLVFSALALLIIPYNFITNNGGDTLGVSSIYLYTSELKGSIWHYVGSFLDVLMLVLALVTIFLYRRRELQVKLCYVLMALALIVSLIASLFSVVEVSEGMDVSNSKIGAIIGIIGILSAYLAARYIKKDIELLKSADRIR